MQFINKNKACTKRGIIVEKIWLKNYPEDVVETIDPDRYQSLVEVFEESVARFPNEIAFTNMSHNMTYQELDTLSKDFAAYCQQTLKLEVGDRLAIMMPNLLQYPVVMFGALRAGLVVVNVNPLYTPRELEHQLKDSGSKAIVVLSNFADTVEKVIENTTELKHVIVTNLGDHFPVIKRVIVNFVVKYIKKMVPSYSLHQAINYGDLIKQGEKLTYKKPVIKGNDLAYLQYTGGTTGLAK